MKKTFIKIILCLIVINIVFSCHKENENIMLTGNVISIQYNPYSLKNLDNKDMYITIDNKTYKHIQDLQGNSIKNPLPSYNNTLMNIEGKKLKEEGTIISISSILFKYLLDSKQYSFINPQGLKLQGKIIFKRKDSKKINIEFPKTYPLNYEIIN